MRSAIATAALIPGLWTATGALAQEQDRLSEVPDIVESERQRLKALGNRAEDLATEINRLQDELVKSAEEVQNREDELTTLERTLAALESAEAEKVQSLAGKQTEVDALLAALQRLSAQPREALLLGFQSPMDTVLTAQLLRYAVPPIEAKAHRLRDDLKEIARLREDTHMRRVEISAATASLRNAREAIQHLVEFKASLRQTTEAELRLAAERVAALAGQASDLRGLLAALPPVAEPPILAPGENGQVAATFRLEPPADLKPFPSKQDGFVPPVRGTQVAGFGDPTEDGGTQQGIIIETLPEAQVVAPHDGQVVFRGPFRGYGQILIIEHRGGYHTLLAGLGRADAVVGQWLLAGEPVGISEAPRDTKPRLYLELRRNGRPIDPWPWFQSQISKAE
ncbi:MAG: murein hydrolase activator EnvC family protein [Dongiaceae bacterium]